MLDTLPAYPQSGFGPTCPTVWTLVKIVCVAVPLTIAWILVLGIEISDATVGLVEVRPL